jgi:hypothetical protein
VRVSASKGDLRGEQRAAKIQDFVSQRHNDEACCRELVDTLHGAGADVWYDEHNLGSVDIPYGLQPDGCSVLRRSDRHASLKALPKPFSVLRGVGRVGELSIPHL